MFWPLPLPLAWSALAITFFLFFNLTNSASSNGNGTRSVCPHRCSCAHSVVICTGLGLDGVPQGIPAETTRLDLQENRIAKISVQDFAPFSSLRILLLSDNLIESIEPGAFDSLVHLERLKLGRNRLHSLPNHLFVHTKRLRRLDLSENSLWALSSEQLAGLDGLISLQLDRNQLQCVDSIMLGRWPMLESLSLQSNSLTSLAELDLESLPRLRNLRLGDNPWYCDCRLRWLKRLKVAPQVRCHRPTLLFGRSLDSVSVQQLKCSGLEKRGVGAGNRRACREADWCPTSCVCTEMDPSSVVVDCHDRGLRSIPQRIPPNTVELRLGQNRIGKLSNHSLAHLPNLIRLDLGKNGITHIEDGAFEGLHQLSSLMLFSNNLTVLPPTVFAGLSSLQVLLLNGNRLQCLRDGLFLGLGQLRLLSLYDNQIRAISKETMRPILKSLQTLHLARNPLICDCNLRWLARHLGRRPIETSGARCQLPKRMAKRLVGRVSAERFRCNGQERMATEGAGHCRPYFFYTSTNPLITERFLSKDDKP